MTLEFEPPSSIDMIAAALRADARDIEVLANSLSTKLSTILPPGMLDVTYEQSLKDRIAKRPKKAIAIRVTTAERTLTIDRRPASAIVYQINQIVRGVVISRREVDLSDWLQALAQELANLATNNEKARDALSQLLE